MGTATMKAVVITGPRQWNLKVVSRPEPGPRDVIIQVGVCGLCGTDLKIFEGQYLSPYPLIPGHEISGTVIGVGDQVPSEWIGARVGLDPTLNCGTCEFCTTGHPNHCEKWGAIGDTVNGGFAEFVSAPVQNIYRLGALSFSEGALVEPMACATTALQRLSMKPGTPALIFGAGPMGLILLSLLQHAQGSAVVMTDRSAERLDIASTLGAETVPASDLARLQLKFPKGFELVVDATGSPAVAQEALHWVRKAGTLLLFGVAPPGAAIEIEPYHIYHHEITITSSMAINQSYGAALSLAQSRLISTAGLVSHVLPLEEYGSAIDLIKQGRGMKIQLAPGAI